MVVTQNLHGWADRAAIASLAFGALVIAWPASAEPSARDAEPERHAGKAIAAAGASLSKANSRRGPGRPVGRPQQPGGTASAGTALRPRQDQGGGSHAVPSAHAAASVPSSPKATSIPSGGPEAVAAPRDPAKSIGAADPDSSSSESISVAKAFCTVNGPAAKEARIAWQTEQLHTLEERAAKKAEELAARSEELRAWIKRRDETLEKADAQLVAIYLKMKPEVAAQQISTMREDMAVSILSHLSARVAGAVFNEMSADKAARLASALVIRPDGARREKADK